MLELIWSVLRSALKVIWWIDGLWSEIYKRTWESVEGVESQIPPDSVPLVGSHAWPACNGSWPGMRCLGRFEAELDHGGVGLDSSELTPSWWT